MDITGIVSARPLYGPSWWMDVAYNNHDLTNDHLITVEKVCGQKTVELWVGNRKQWQIFCVNIHPLQTATKSLSPPRSHESSADVNVFARGSSLFLKAVSHRWVVFFCSCMTWRSFGVSKSVSNRKRKKKTPTHNSTTSSHHSDAGWLHAEFRVMVYNCVATQFEALIKGLLNQIHKKSILMLSLLVCCFSIWESVLL